jgi:hypothetical protein
MNRPMHKGLSLRPIILAATVLALTTRCTDEDWRAGQNQPIECLPYAEVRKRCNEAFNDCLDSPIQSIPSETRGHSLCHVCQDVCMQKNGVWPDRLLDGRPCR